MYIVFDTLFIQCKFGGCKQMQGTFISAVEKDKVPVLTCADPNANTCSNPDITTKENAFNAANQNLSTRRASLTNAELELVESISNLKPDDEGEDRDDSQKVASPAQKIFDARKKAVERAEAEKKAALDDVVATRANISARYTSRSVWVFFTGVYLVLFIAVVWFTFSVMSKALDDLQHEKLKKWLDKLGIRKRASDLIQKYFYQILTTLLAIGLFGVILAMQSRFMSVVAPMYEATLFTSGDLSRWLVYVFNALAFAVIVYLVAASCSMLYKVRKFDKKTEAAKFEPWRDTLRAMLIIGAALLVVGLFRMNTLTSWHLTFVGDDYKKLLEDFFENMLLVQGLFYTIILGATYLPVLNEFPTEVEESVEDSVKNNGFWKTIMIYAPRLILIISPLLAPALGRWITSLLGDSSALME